MDKEGFDGGEIMVFFFGYVNGFLTALFLIYLIRREVEQVANGERVATNKKNEPMKDIKK